jgi:hypothetical protein
VQQQIKDSTRKGDYKMKSIAGSKCATWMTAIVLMIGVGVQSPAQADVASGMLPT